MEDETPNVPTEESVAELKLNLLQVLCLHEHYVQLNLPYPHSLFNEKNSIKPHQVSSIKLYYNNFEAGILFITSTK